MAKRKPSTDCDDGANAGDLDVNENTTAFWPSGTCPKCGAEKPPNTAQCPSCRFIVASHGADGDDEVGSDWLNENAEDEQGGNGHADDTEPFGPLDQDDEEVVFDDADIIQERTKQHDFQIEGDDPDPDQAPDDPQPELDAASNDGLLDGDISDEENAEAVAAMREDADVFDFFPADDFEQDTADQMLNKKPQAEQQTKTKTSLGNMATIHIVKGEIARIADDAETALIKAANVAPIMVRAGMLVRPIIDKLPASHDRTTEVTLLKPLSTGTSSIC